MFDPASLRYDAAGLIPAVAQDAGTGEVLMLAWMNAEAVARTLESGHVTYWSRSRRAFWIKGETSGHVQRLVEMRIDCDRGRAAAARGADRSGLPHRAQVVLLHRAARRRRG